MEEFWNSIHRLGTSTAYRERMTFVACYQQIALSGALHTSLVSPTVLNILFELAHDRIVDVRIRVARLLGTFQGAPICLNVVMGLDERFATF